MNSVEGEVSIINGSVSRIQTMDLIRKFEENADSPNCRGETAIIFDKDCGGHSSITYQELNESANRIANFFIRQISENKLKRNADGDWIIAVCMPPSLEMIVTLLAIWKAGAAYLPIEVTFPNARIDHILEEAKPTLIIYDTNSVKSDKFYNHVKSFAFTKCKALSSDYNDVNIPDEFILQSASSCHLAIVLYTSGSSGVPKGVRIPHSAVMNRLQWQWETFPYSPTEQTCVFKTAFTFVDSVSEIWSPLLMRKTLLVVPKSITSNPSKMIATLENHKVERLVLVPSLLKSLLTVLSMDKQHPTLRNLRLWVCSGETLPVALAREFYEYFPENEYALCNFYGSTEVMGDVTYFKCQGMDRLHKCESNVPIGIPIFNNTIYILNPEGRPLRMGEVGEICVSGANVALGYANGRENERFIENRFATNPIHSRLYRTGDYASMSKGGVIHYGGRIDSQVKVRGHRVDLSEIDNHLIIIIEVKEAFVLSHNTGRIDQTLLAFVRVDSNTSINEFDIERILSSKLPEYMIPQVMIVDDIPLLVNGKTDRQTLLKMYETHSNNNGDGVAEIDYNGVRQTDMAKAKILFETISEVVGKSARVPISLKSNFYAMGGNSLNSIHTIAKLRDQGYAIDITSFIKAVSLKGILEAMTELGSEQIQDAISVGEGISFEVEALSFEHKDETLPFLASSSQKSRAYSYVSPPVTLSENLRLYEELWEFFVEQDCSFVIKDESERIVGVALNQSAAIEQPSPHINPQLHLLDELFLSVECPISDQLPQDKFSLYANFLATHGSLSAQQNIAAVIFMENETIRLAKRKNIYGILTSNVSPLTLQLANSMYGFETLLDYQINQYVTADGQKPFAHLSDSERITIQFKKL